MQEGMVSRQVCFNWRDCCQWKINIRIRNCGDFYVYELKAPGVCGLRYCGGPFDSSNLTSRLLMFYYFVFLPFFSQQ